MAKFLHAADVHLDSPLRGLERYEGAPADRVRGASRKALGNLVDLAIGERVDFVLLAGDLYDGDWPDYNTGLYLVKLMSRLKDAGIPVFVIQGNHDADNRMTRSLKLPENVKVFSTECPETVPMEHLGVAIHGQGFATAKVKDDLSRRYPAAIRDYFNIGLLHTCAEGSEGHERYAPCSVGGLSRKEYQYWALGHIHQRGVLSERPFIAFSGNLQGRHARETGPKGCLLVETDGGESRTEFRRLDVVRWEDCEVGIGEARNEEDVADFAAEALSERLAGEPVDHLLAARVTLMGASALHDRLVSNPERCIAAVRSRAMELGVDRVWVEKVKIRTSPPSSGPALDDGAWAEVIGVLNELKTSEMALRKVQEEMKDLRTKVSEELCQGADGVGLSDTVWMHERLDEVEAILRTRLMGEVDG